MSVPSDPHRGDDHETQAGHGQVPRDDRRGSRPTQRQMLSTYLGFDQPPPVRPSWWADLLWLVPVDIGLLYLVVTQADQKAIPIVLIAFVSVLVYMSAVRVRFANLLDRHPELRQPQREPVVRRRQPPGN